MRPKAGSILIFLAMFAACSQVQQSAGAPVDRAFEQHLTDVRVEGEGTVAHVLHDDTAGSPHQRFIVKLASGRTVLIDHNIEIAPRMDDLNVGDTVGFSGEYVWNDQGGLVHWTHHDPAGRHADGWLKHNGRTYR